MNVLFINPSTSRYTRSVSVPLGLLSIASYLESKGHKVRIYDRTVDKTKLERIVSEFAPGIIGISVISYKSIMDTLLLAKAVSNMNIPVFVGGPLPSVLVEQTLKCDFIKGISLGEGEETWAELVEAYRTGAPDLKAIKGLAFKTASGEITYTGERNFVDLGALSPLNWELLDVTKYFQSSYGCKKMLYLYAAKGCPHSCTFCYNKDFHKCTYRKRPLNVLLDEIKHLVTTYGMDGVYFADELWCRNQKEMKDICENLKSLDLNFVWGCQTRIGLFSEEDFNYMYDCGCRWIFFGIESGSKRVLDKINKKIQYDKIVETFKACRNANIACIGSFIAGFPDETVDDLKETVMLINQLDTSLINMNYLALVPGSEIYNGLVKSGKYIEETTLEEFAKKSPMERLEYNYSQIPDKDIKVIRAYYMWRSFTATDVPGTEKYGFARKVVTDALKSVKTGEFIGFIASTFSAGMEFLKIMFYANFFPHIKKKYGVNNK
ncbi:MAG: B12-binding domain-containing radical SAM protein [Ruminococcaceae bacterium]|nr:B12-binding domain-containing radical SAM protein [Oscillospiraceae bacterium]